MKDLEEEFIETDRARLRRRLPWLLMFDAFRIARDPRKILLAAAGLLIWMAGEFIISRLPFAEPLSPTDVPRFPAAPIPTLANVLEDPWGTIARAFSHGAMVLQPFEHIVEPGRRLFTWGNTWADTADAWTHLLWSLLVWGLFGGAVARIAAADIAGAGRVSMATALRYAARRILSYLGAPLLPLVFITILWALCALLGAVGSLLGVQALVGVLWFVPLICGFLMMLLVVSVAVGWPLMICTISAEDGDAFEGFSRAYSYIFERPWYALWLTVLAMLYGSAIFFVVISLLRWSVHLAGWSVSAGLGAEETVGLLHESPSLLRPEAIRGVRIGSGDGATAAGYWMQALGLLLAGFLYSYFWTAAALIFALLRLSDDATPLTHFVPERPNLDPGDPQSPLPLVGMPAAERREQESAANTERGDYTN